MTPLHEEILTRIQAGTRVDRIADLVGVDRRTVIGVAHQHRYRITRHGTAELIGDPPMTTTTDGSPLTARTTPSLSAAAAAVHELTHHRDPKIAKAAVATRERMSKLIDLLEEYDSKAAARAEVERLEAQLRQAKQKLRGTPPSSSGRPDMGADSKTIRAWATANGIDCPRVGRVPQAVVDAYNARAAA